MRDRPSGEALARLAADIGGDDPLAERCRAVAAREAVAGDGAFEPIRAALRARYGEGADGDLLRRYAQAIEAGAFDEAGAAQDWAWQLLWAITRQKLRESNPDFLAANDPPLRAP